MGGIDLTKLCLSSARDEVRKGSLETALDWLNRVAQAERPPEFECELRYALAKRALARGEWGLYEEHLSFANSLGRSSLFAKRLELLRRRKLGLDDHAWEVLVGAVDPAERLSSGSLRPEITGIWACGAYHSRGRGRTLPWTKFLRMAKEPAEDPESDVATVRLAGAYLCRFIQERTPILETVDFVTAVPANPARFAVRMRSLPDELAKSVEQILALPHVFNLLRYVGPDDLRARDLGWAERRRALDTAFECGEAGAAKGQRILLLDDVTTSGATLKSAARCLLAAGAAEILAAALSHTEG